MLDCQTLSSHVRLPSHLSGNSQCPSVSDSPVLEIRTCLLEQALETSNERSSAMEWPKASQDMKLAVKLARLNSFKRRARIAEEGLSIMWRQFVTTSYSSAQQR